MMSDVHHNLDGGFLERFAAADQEVVRHDIGWKAFLCRQHCHGNLVVDTTQKGHYRVSHTLPFVDIRCHVIQEDCILKQWLALISLAIMYNYVFIVGRAVFWDMQNLFPVVWMVLDYTCDVIYILDMIIHAHEGLASPYDCVTAYHITMCCCYCLVVSKL